MSEQPSLGALLKRYRLAVGCSQEALAERAHVSTRSISDLERGLHRTPHPDTLEALAAALSLSPEERATLRAVARPELARSGRTGASLRPAAVPEPGSTGSTTLPVPPTRLIGRESEVQRACAFLREGRTRLLTITGPGGVGKTRLALEVAHALAPSFHDAAVFVDLAPVREAALVPALVAQALGLREQAGLSPVALVRSYLKDREILLVLDNTEQIPGSASFVADLLAWCPGVRLLATGRAPLRVRGEQEWPLGPLALPAATALFCERASAIRPGVECAEDQAAAICKRLDCLPLAIELAAVQVKAFALADLHEHLTGRLALLRDGPRDLPVRHQTMRDALAWSYDLLPAELQGPVRRLAVFAGGCTIDAAQEVCWAAGQITRDAVRSALAALVDASLVQVEVPAAGRSRFRLLELVGEYALERLAEAGEEETCRGRHAAYFARLADELPPFGPGAGAGAANLLEESPNVRAAMEWAEARGEVEMGLRLIVGFGRFWLPQGQISEAARWFERMLALAGCAGGRLPPSLRGLRHEAFNHYCRALQALGKRDEAETHAMAALRQAEQRADHEGMCVAFGVLGSIAQARGQLDAAVQFYEQSEAEARCAEDVRPWLKSTTLLRLAEAARQKGDLARAATLFGQLLAETRAAGLTWLVASLTTLLGHVACQQSDYGLAQARYREALALFGEFRNPSETAWCLEGYAKALLALGAPAASVRLCAAAAHLRAEARTPLPPAEMPAFEQTLAATRAALDESVYREEWRTGSSLTIEQAIDYAVKLPPIGIVISGDSRLDAQR